jgi:hypothetical protein
VVAKTTPVDHCHMLNVGTGLRYDCDGFIAAFHDDPPNASTNPQGSLDQMVAGLVEGFRNLGDRVNAKIHVEKSMQRIGGKDVLAAKVAVDAQLPPGMSYAGGFAVVDGHRGILCTADSGPALERCEPVVRFLVEDHAP